MGYPDNISLVTGRFNALHAGHIRLFRYARSLSGFLVVAVQSNTFAMDRRLLDEKLRLEGVEACTLVDKALIYDSSVNDLILRLKPTWVVKGKEHEKTHNEELLALSQYGGRLVFNSGEFELSTSELIRSGSESIFRKVIALPDDYLKRHNISTTRLGSIVEKFEEIKVLTIGDLIVDEYISCEPLGMSQEDPTIVVTPTEERRFIGGAGIVAAHGAGLGAQSSFISVIGADNHGEMCRENLAESKVLTHLLVDSSRPTTTKRRYRCRGQTLLRVSKINQSDVSKEIQQRIIDQVAKLSTSLDLLIFSDFNYGVLTNYVIDEISRLARKQGIFLAADSQSSSQFGDIARYKQFDLVTPTEREARLSLQNKDDGLVVLIEQLRKRSGSRLVLLKLGADGVLIHGSNASDDTWLTDRIDALNKFPVDVAGAGDSMLVSTALALVAGATIWEASVIGSISSAIQISRIGNTPITANEIRHYL